MCCIPSTDLPNLHPTASRATLKAANHKPVAISTVSKWAKAVLKVSGVDITCFSGNSGRSASTSYSAQSGLPLKDILKAGGWSKVRTFARYYNKPVQANFGSHILAHFNNSSTSETILSSRSVALTIFVDAQVYIYNVPRLSFHIKVWFTFLNYPCTPLPSTLPPWWLACPERSNLM